MLNECSSLSELTLILPVPKRDFWVWMESNHLPLSYQDSVLPMNYTPDNKIKNQIFKNVFNKS